MQPFSLWNSIALYSYLAKLPLPAEEGWDRGSKAFLRGDEIPMDIKAWFHFFGVNDNQVKSAIVESLTGAGITTYALDLDRPCGPGILFFEDISQTLYDFLHQVSRNGMNHVLAILVSESGLGNGDIWSLLQVGASDVFTWHCQPDPASQAVARLERWNAVDQLVNSPLVRNNLIGQSLAWN